MTKWNEWLAAGGIALSATFASAQGPDDGPGGPGSGDLVARMMAFDKDGDGTLTKAEVTDSRLSRLFDRADADKDGVVTKAELTAMADKEKETDRNRPRGPGGPGGPGGFGGPPRPGEVLPPPVRQRLKLSAEQSKKLDDLQKDVDAKLDAILDDGQKDELKAMRQRGPGRGGPPPAALGPTDRRRTSRPTDLRPVVAVREGEGRPASGFEHRDRGPAFSTEGRPSAHQASSVLTTSPLTSFRRRDGTISTVAGGSPELHG